MRNKENCIKKWIVSLLLLLLFSPVFRGSSYCFIFFPLFCCFQQMAKRVDVPQSKSYFDDLKSLRKIFLYVRCMLTHRVVIYKSNSDSSPDWRHPSRKYKNKKKQRRGENHRSKSRLNAWVSLVRTKRRENALLLSVAVCFFMTHTRRWYQGAECSFVDVGELHEKRFLLLFRDRILSLFCVLLLHDGLVSCCLVNYLLKILVSVTKLYVNGFWARAHPPFWMSLDETGMLVSSS